MSVDPRVVTLARGTAARVRAAGREDLAASLLDAVDALAARDPRLRIAVAGRPGSGRTALIEALTAALGADVPVFAEAPVDAGAAQGADAVVLVLEPETPIGAGERRFLEGVADDTAAVVFVIARADLTLHAEEMLGADRRLLAALDARWADAPLYAVSAREHAIALADLDEPMALGSGLPALTEHLRARLLVNPAIVRTAAALHRCRTTLAALDAVAAAGPAEGAATAAERHRAYVARTADWAGEFAREYHRRTRKVIERELRLRLLERREQQDLRIKSGRMALEEVTAQVKLDLEAVAERMEAALIEQVEALVADWSGLLDLGPVALQTQADAVGAAIPAARVDIATVDWREREVAHGLAGAVNMARSAATGRSLAGVLPGGLAMGTGLGIVLTGLTWLSSEWLRTRVQDQQGALAFVQAAFARAQIDLEAALRDQASMLQPAAQGALDRGVGTRRQSLASDAVLAEEEEAQRAAERAAAVEQAERVERELAPWTRRIHELDDRFAAFLSGGEVEPGQDQ